MHTFSPARMWIAGLRALQVPLLHLHTQFNRDLPWADIDMDFMNLHQAAHGDREFGFIETRLGVARKTVVGHWEDPRVPERIGAWARAACGWHEAHHLRVARFGDNMRHVADTEGDKVEAQIRSRGDRQRLPFERADRGRARGARRGGRGRARPPTTPTTQSRPSSGADGARRDELREAARIEVGLRSLLTAGGFGAFTDTFEDLGGLEQLPGIAVQRLMADGYGFGAEGRLEERGAGPPLQGDGERLPGGTSFMEDYTYHLDPAGPLVLGAHMLEICPSLAARPAVVRDPPARRSADGPIRSGSCSTPRRVPGWSRR